MCKQRPELCDIALHRAERGCPYALSDLWEMQMCGALDDRYREDDAPWVGIWFNKLTDHPMAKLMTRHDCLDGCGRQPQTTAFLARFADRDDTPLALFDRFFE